MMRQAVISSEKQRKRVTLTKVKHLHFCAFRAFCVNLNEHECRYDSQSTQMGADCAEKGHTESTEITEIFSEHKSHESYEFY